MKAEPNIAGLVRRILSAYGAKELLALLDGESEFTTDENPGAPQDRELARSWSVARLHLTYMIHSGREDGEPIQVGNHAYSSYRQEFEHWLLLGAPGLFIPELERIVGIVNANEPQQSLSADIPDSAASPLQPGCG
ncbi:hypothetical protein [Nitrogeniibacter aestuarii]|uniref:hypothetical protein n=1 Tax=Nitrogeniibacter aestuarii TaxID=2815343 RepID=UPI001D0FAB8F|nr:hypothetical protein [Nitrogeniibacter aestuarii]